MSRPPIYGYVPGAPLLPSPLPEGIRVSEDEQIEEEPAEEAPRRGKRPKRAPESQSSRDQSWRKGYPRNTTRQEILEGRAVPLSNRPPAMLGGNVERCPVCKIELSVLTLQMVREMTRGARDRLAYGGAHGQTDLLYLAARMDGYCSLGCWQERAPKALVSRLLGGSDVE